MTNHAPVEQVGGTQSNGPWREEVTEIAEGEAYQRPVPLSDGTTKEVQVTVASIDDVMDEQANPTGGYAVALQFDDPTLDGGSL